jgi:hypothetical protein
VGGLRIENPNLEGNQRSSFKSHLSTFARIEAQSTTTHLIGEQHASQIECDLRRNAVSGIFSVPFVLSLSLSLSLPLSLSPSSPLPLTHWAVISRSADQFGVPGQVHLQIDSNVKFDHETIDVDLRLFLRGQVHCQRFVSIQM